MTTTNDPAAAQPYLLDLSKVRREHLALVGGKATGLGELAQVDGARVPAGFCVTTAVLQQVTDHQPWFTELTGRLSRLAPEDGKQIRAVAGELRRHIEQVAVVPDATAAIVGGMRRFPSGTAFAVRSSATAEDLPSASFAGQQDTFLNVLGTEAVLRRVRSCWASWFTDRAVAYRLRHGIDQQGAGMAVVVQEMLTPRASGVLFTADPVTGNRTLARVEATVGLGEALMSGVVNPDAYAVAHDRVTERTVSRKTRASYAVDDGGTRERAIPADQQDEAVLTDAQVLDLVELGYRVEAHIGRPQDIEWCLVGESFHLVQARPITTLFPIPHTDASGNRVYLSVGHQQMMTEAIKPLGISFWQLTTPRPMAVAGGRLFVDVTERLASPATREPFLAATGRSDPLMRDALETHLAREDFLPEAPTTMPDALPQEAAEPLDADPTVVTGLIERTRASLAAVERDITAVRGPELFEFILADFRELRAHLFDADSLRPIMAALNAAEWLNRNLGEWLGEENPADALTQSVPNNVTSEMGLDLLNVADAIRPHSQVVAFLRGTEDAGFLDRLPDLPGADLARAAIQDYLDAYGMRCVGEIDITRPRWSEQPTALLPALLANVDNFVPGEAARRFEAGHKVAQAKEQDVLERLRARPGGADRAVETKQKIEVLRTFIGLREFPKYGMVSRYLIYKRALLAEAAGLVADGVLADVEDVFFLTFEEFRDAVSTRRVDRDLIHRRAREQEEFRALPPPRVLTSDGEALAGQYHRQDMPPGALVGLPVSAGIVEGRARVVHDVGRADLQPGDILVTAFTDPSWSPLFVTIAGLVTEVGGLMTHGAVVAREYGLVAVVGVEGATERIEDGQRIRVDGTRGSVQVLT